MRDLRLPLKGYGWNEYLPIPISKNMIVSGLERNTAITSLTLAEYIDENEFAAGSIRSISLTSRPREKRLSSA